MRALVLIAMLLSFAMLFAQEGADAMYNKNGVFLGNESEIMNECISDFKDDPETQIYNSVAICKCILDVVFDLPLIANARDEAIIDTTDFEALFTNDSTIYNALQSCGTDAIRMDVPLNTMGPDAKKEMAKECSEGVKNSPELKAAKLNPYAYCNCLYDEIWKRDLTFTDMGGFDNVNSVEHNEITLPCMTNSIGSTTMSSKTGSRAKKTRSVRMAESPDIKGPRLTDRVPLISMGRLHKVKLDLAGNIDYYIIDSGASDCMISGEFMRKMQEEGTLRNEQFLDPTEYTLADGRTVKCKRFTADFVGLGTFRINNVEFGVLDEEDVTFLLGKSLLNKFTTWTIEQQTSVLYLKK